MPDPEEFPHLFRHYEWSGSHSDFGNLPDCYPGFCWIDSLESRFANLRYQHIPEGIVAHYLLKEMVLWGGNQNGLLERFKARLGEYALIDVLLGTINVLHEPAEAIERVLTIPEFGLTYGSKLLRFLDPIRYGALDSTIARAMELVIRQHNQATRYVEFIEFLDETKQALVEAGIGRPECNLSADANNFGWRNADVEMSLFAWANRQPQD
jgi:hypothetical protein